LTCGLVTILKFFYQFGLSSNLFQTEEIYGNAVAVIFSKDHSRSGIVKEVFEDFIQLEVSGYQETDTFFIRLSAIDMFYEPKNA
jgi:hypothetical protein